MTEYDVIRVTGLKEAQSALRGVDRELPKALRVGLNEVADIVVQAARSKVPSITGAARDSIKARSTQTAARIAVGGTKAPYFPWLDFGGRTGRGHRIVRPFIQGGRYIYPTLREKSNEVREQLRRVLDDVLRQAGVD